MRERAQCRNGFCFCLYRKKKPKETNIFSFIYFNLKSINFTHNLFSFTRQWVFQIHNMHVNVPNRPPSAQILLRVFYPILASLSLGCFASQFCLFAPINKNVPIQNETHRSRRGEGEGRGRGGGSTTSHGLNRRTEKNYKFFTVQHCDLCTAFAIRK